MVKFYSEFSDYLDSLLQKPGRPIIAGDFNFHIEDSTSHHATEFMNLLHSRGFIQHINEPTHISGGTLDLLITRDNVSDFMNLENINISDSGIISDHSFLSCKLLFSAEKKVMQLKNVCFRKYNEIDLELFRQDIKSSNIYCNDFISLDDAVEKYNATLTDLLNKHAPIVERRFYENKNKWWSKECTKARQARRKAERKYNRLKTPELKQIFKDISKSAARVINNARDSYFRNSLSEFRMSK